VTGSRLVLPRLLESFFRRPLVCLLPALVFSALGVLSIVKSERTYASSGVLSVSNETLLSTLTEVGSQGGFSWETPATQTSRQINELLGTDQFARSVAEGAGLATAIDAGVYTLDQLRESVGAYDTGNNLVTVKASTGDAALAQKLATSTIDSFINWVIDGDIGESTAAEQFFEGLLANYEDDVDAARGALAQYLAEHPATDPDRRPAEEQSEIARLSADVDRAENRYSTALTSSENARLATEQARSDVSQRLRLVDTPQVPYLPESSRQAQLLKVAMYAVTGILLSIVLVVVGAALDHSLRFPDEVRRRIGLDVLAVVPEARR
jgi:uncharacterized protein involved in exopolysaccharide biosynthesis